jgi:signal transduction histidine kinase
VTTASLALPWGTWKTPKASAAALAIISIAAYVGLDRLGLAIARGTPSLAPWNPGVAILIVILLLRGFRWLPVLSAAVLCAALADGAPLRHLVELAVYAGAAWTLRGPLRIDPDLQNFDDVFRFAAVALLAATMTAAFDAGLQWSAGTPLSALATPFLRYWLGDMIGLSVTGPLLLVHRAALAHPARWRVLLSWQCLAQAGAILGTLYLMFPRVVGSRFYPMFIPLVWVAARHGLAGVAAALMPIQLCFVSAMVALDLAANQQVKLQILMLSLSLTGLGLGAVISERERARAAAIESESRLKAMRADLDRRRFEIEHASRSSLTGELAAALAHELNQPLAAVVNYIGASQRTLLTGGDGSQAVEQMIKAAAQAERAGQVIRRMREFFCNAAVSAEPMPVADMVADVLLLMADEALRAGAVFELDLPAGLVAEADKIQIEQVLINLVRNSLDALAGAPGRKVVRLSAARHEAGWIRLSIGDTGPGIDQEVSGSLFTPFTTTRSFGMGLGLTISRSIVQAHGGKLWLDETPGEGTLMHFTLPEAS